MTTFIVDLTYVKPAVINDKQHHVMYSVKTFYCLIALTGLKNMALRQ